MTLVHAITPEKRRHYRDALDQHFRLRHEVFVKERGWFDLAREDERERDEYDTDETTYLLAIDCQTVVGGLRLNPTTSPYMLETAFPYLVFGTPPRSPEIVECSRYFVTKGRRFGRADALLLAAVQAHCLEHEITQLVAVVELWWMPRLFEAGYKTRPLGPPANIAGLDCVALQLDVSTQTLETALSLAGRSAVLSGAVGLEGELPRYVS